MTPKPHDAVDADRDLEMTLETLDEHWPQAVKRIRAELKRLRAPRSDAGLRSASASGVGVDENLLFQAQNAIAAWDRLYALINPRSHFPKVFADLAEDTEFREILWLRRAIERLSRETGATQSDGGVEGHAIPQTTSATTTRYPATEGERHMVATARRNEAQASTKTGQAGIKPGPLDSDQSELKSEGDKS